MLSRNHCPGFFSFIHPVDFSLSFIIGIPLITLCLLVSIYYVYLFFFLSSRLLIELSLYL